MNERETFPIPASPPARRRAHANRSRFPEGLAARAARRGESGRADGADGEATGITDIRFSGHRRVRPGVRR